MASEFIEIISPNAKQQIADITKDVEALAKLIAQINNFKPANTPSGADANINSLNKSYSERVATMKLLRLELEKVNNTQKTFNQLQQESAQRINSTATASQGMFSKMSAGLKSVIQLFGVYSAAMLAHRAIMGTIGISSKFSDNLAQLAIYLNNSKESADEVFKSLTKIKTRTSLTDLLGLAEIVAKKGVVKAEIAGITAELDKLFLVVGEGLGDKEEATASIVKLISIFNTDGEITGTRIKEVGASLQYLTTHGVATGDYLIRFAERLGAVRSLTGQTMPEILGMGAAFEQLGVKAEVGANATGQIIAKLFTDIPKYAKEAGLDVQEFKYLLETDSTTALLKFAEGLKKTSKDSEMFSLKLKGAQLQGVRVKSVLSEIAIQGDLFREKIQGAVKATEDLGKNSQSAELKQKTFAATLANIRKEWETLITSTSSMDGFKTIATGVGALVSAIMKIPFSLIVSGLATWTAYKIALNAAIIKNSIALTANIAKEGAYAIANGFSTSALVAKTVALEAEVVALNQQIASEIVAIELLEAEALVNLQNTEAISAEIIAREANIAVLSGQVVATEAVITSNKAMTASLASTGWGALAIVIGLAVYAIWEMASATDAAKNSAEELLALTDRNAVILKRVRDRETKEFDERIKNEEYKNRLLVESKKKTAEQALKDNNEYLIKEAGQYAEAHKKSQNQKQKELDVLTENIHKEMKLREDMQKLDPNANVRGVNDRIKAAEKLARTKKQEIDLQISEQKRYLEIQKEGFRIRSLENAKVELTPEQIKVKTQAEEKRQKAIEEALKTEYDLKMSNLEREKELIKDLRDNKETSLEDMLFLEQAFAYKEIQIIQAVYDEEVRLAGVSGEKQQIALNKFLTAKENAIKESQDRQVKSQEDFTKEQLQKTKDWYAKNPPIGIFETGTSKEDREAKENELREAFKARVKIFNEYIGEFADKSGFGESFNFFTELDKNGKTMWEKLIQDAEDGKVKFEDVFMGISTIAQDAFNLITEASNARFDAEYSRLEKQKEDALRFAGDSDAAKKKIEEDYEKRRKKIAEREFKAKQKQTIANIAMDTAQAIMQIWAHSPDPSGISQGLMTAIISSIGAIQVGIVAAQKVPQYFKGTDNAEAGLAWTQERGAEIVLDKHDRIKSFGSDGGAQLTMMEKGDKVKTADQTKKLMFDNGLNAMLSNNGIKEAKIEIINKGLTVDEMDLIMAKHLGSRSTQNINFDKNGFSTYVSKNGNITRRNEDRGSGIGITV